jgi:hypothetical protein
VAEDTVACSSSLELVAILFAHNFWLQALRFDGGVAISFFLSFWPAHVKVAPRMNDLGLLFARYPPAPESSVNN